jgi:hypothetical protein
MGFVDPYAVSSGETRAQRWGHYLAIVVILASLLLGVNLRDSVLYATQPYSNVQFGIRAEYPRGWLLETSSDFVLRVRDMSRPDYKTTIQVSVYPFTASMTTRNVLDDLALRRAQTLATFRTLSIAETTLRGGEAATVSEFRFVATDANPFQESIPSVVLGRDILTVRSGQAILVTFLANELTFNADLAYFQRFLDSFEF